MTTTRRGFLASLLAIPAVAKLLPAKSLNPWTTMWPPGAKVYAEFYHDRLYLDDR